MLNVLLNLALFTIKFIGGKLSKSVSVISDAFNNLTDAVSTMFSWFGIKISKVGAGDKHPNGHGRFEWIIALVAAISVILVGWELLMNSIDAIKDPTEIVFTPFVIVALSLSIVVKVIMFIYNRNKGKKTNYSSLKAIAIDSLSDAVSTTVVLISLIVDFAFGLQIDGICGILVSLFIFYNGFSSFIDTTQRIMGTSASKEKLDKLREFILTNSNVKEVNNLQIEDYGNNSYKASMTIIGNKESSYEELHKTASSLRYLISNKFGYKSIITIEKENDIDTEVKQIIENIFAKEKMNLEIRSLFTSNTEDSILIELEIGYYFYDIDSKINLRDILETNLKAINPKYELLLSTKLKTMDRETYQKRYHGKHMRKHHE